ncbi:citrate:proton symporter [Brevibacterium sp. UMB10442]|nr:citrate:proton symporter [Brevibacterium sp. UMB10442]
MLVVIGFVLVFAIVVLLVTRKVSPIVAFSVLPLIAGLAAGFSPSELGEFMGEGINTVMPTAVLFIFAILFFGLMRDRGLFDPVVNGLVGLIRERPVGLTLVTVLVAMVTHVDGVGATTFLLTIPALLPVYDRMKVRRLVLVMLTGLTAGIVNMVPWGGPTLRAATAVGEDVRELWLPLVFVQIFGILLIISLAVFMGRVETKRIAAGLNDNLLLAHTARGSFASDEVSKEQMPPEKTNTDANLSLSVRDWKFWANAVIALAVLVGLFLGVMPLHLLFLIGFGVALLVNFRSAESQDGSLARHAKDALSMGGILIIVGVFLGVLTGTGMLSAMGDALVSLTPQGAAMWVHVVFAVFAVPLGMSFGPDAMFFGILPLIAEVAAGAGVPSIDVARAILIAENTGFSISPVVPSVYLLVGLAGVKLGDHIRFTFFWAWAISVILLIFALLTGIVGF